MRGKKKNDSPSAAGHVWAGRHTVTLQRSLQCQWWLGPAVARRHEPTATKAHCPISQPASTGRGMTVLLRK
jgi:hypothetical protein